MTQTNVTLCWTLKPSAYLSLATLHEYFYISLLRSSVFCVCIENWYL